MRNLYIVLILAAIIIVSGCAGTQEPVKEEINETPVVENVTPVEPKEIVNESIPADAEKTPGLVAVGQVGAGEDADLIAHKEKLYIAYQRFKGESEDIYVTAYNEIEIKPAEKIADTELNDLTPSFSLHQGILYLFWTQATEKKGFADVQFKSYEGETWSKQQKADELDGFFYYHNQSGVAFNNKLLMFWTYGGPGEQGKIGTQYYNGKSWDIGIKVSVETVNEKAPKVSVNDSTIYMIYEAYVSNANSNDVYYKEYTNAWSGPVKLSGSIKTDFKSSGDIIKFNGKIYALWVAGGDIYLSIKEGGEWKDPVKLTDSGNTGEPSIEEYNGELYVVYTQIGENRAAFVYLAKLEV